MTRHSGRGAVLRGPVSGSRQGAVYMRRAIFRLIFVSLIQVLAWKFSYG